MGNGELDKNSIINWTRLSAMINLVLFALPGSILFLILFTSIISAGIAGLFNFLVMLVNPFMLISVISFAISIKYLKTKNLSKFSKIFLICTVFINFISNLMVIAIIQLSKAS